MVKPYETVRGGVTFAGAPRLARSEPAMRQLWRLSERLTGVAYPEG